MHIFAVIQFLLMMVMRLDYDGDNGYRPKGIMIDLDVDGHCDNVWLGKPRFE